MTDVKDTFKKIMLAGVGAVAVGTEKAEAVIDELAKRGEITVEQGKIINEELKRKVSEKKQSGHKIDVSRLTSEERAELLKQLRELEDTEQ